MDPEPKLLQGQEEEQGRQLLPNLTQTSMIILDNVAYHRVLLNHVPKVGKIKRAELTDYLQSKDLEVNEKKIAKEYIADTEPMAIIHMSQPHGHKILFTPPYHSDLQPIELLWALVKGKVGRQYHEGTAIDMVHQRLIDEFDS